MNEIMAEFRHGLANRLLLNSVSKIKTWSSHNPVAIYCFSCFIQVLQITAVFCAQQGIEMHARFQSVFSGQINWKDVLNHYCVRSTNFQLSSAEPAKKKKIFFCVTSVWSASSP